MKQEKSDPFMAIADPSRRHILQLLTRDNLTINAIAENFDMSRPAISKHVKILYTAGFIAIEDIGRERYCKLNREGFKEMQTWINHFDSFWESKFSNLAIMLKAHPKSKKS